MSCRWVHADDLARASGQRREQNARAARYVENTRNLRAQSLGDTLRQLGSTQDGRCTKRLGLPGELPLDRFIVLHQLPSFSERLARATDRPSSALVRNPFQVDVHPGDGTLRVELEYQGLGNFGANPSDVHEFAEPDESGAFFELVDSRDSDVVISKAGDHAGQEGNILRATFHYVEIRSVAVDIRSQTIGKRIPILSAKCADVAFEYFHRVLAMRSLDERVKAWPVTACRSQPAGHILTRS